MLFTAALGVSPVLRARSVGLNSSSPRYALFDKLFTCAPSAAW